MNREVPVRPRKATRQAHGLSHQHHHTMNFEKAEDRENHQLLTMERKLDSMNAVNEAQGRLYRMF